MSEKDQRAQGASPGRTSENAGAKSHTPAGTSNAQMVNVLQTAKRGSVPVYMGENTVDLSLPDVEQVPASADAADTTGTLDRYHAWLAAVKALKSFEDQHSADLFSYGVGETAQERYALRAAVQKTFSAMAPEEQRIVYESEMRFAEWKKDFDARCAAEDKERRRVWMYEYAGLDPDVRVPPATLNAAFERARQDKARQSLHDDITTIPNLIGESIQSASNQLYKAGHVPTTGNEGWLGGAAKTLWNLGVDGAHMIGHVGGSAVQTAGEVAGGAAVTAADPGGSFDRFVEDKESSRKNIRQTLADGGSRGVVSEAHAAVLAYTPGLKDIGEGFSNTSLESTEQTEAWKNRSAADRVAQSAGGIGSLSGTLAGVGGAASKAKALIKPKGAKAALPKTSSAGAGARAATPDARVGRYWEADDFLGGKMDDATATALRKELDGEIGQMKLTPDEIKDRGMERGLTGLNNAPEEWLPKYKKGQTNPQAYNDLWGTNASTNSRHAAEAATKKLDEYRASMAKGELPTGKQHWSQYGDSPKEAVHAMRRLGKTYSLLETKTPAGNPTARARAAIFDTLADWAEKTEGLKPGK